MPDGLSNEAHMTSQPLSFPSAPSPSPRSPMLLCAVRVIRSTPDPLAVDVFLTSTPIARWRVLCPQRLLEWEPQPIKPWLQLQIAGPVVHLSTRIEAFSAQLGEAAVKLLSNLIAVLCLCCLPVE